MERFIRGRDGIELVNIAVKVDEIVEWINKQEKQVENRPTSEESRNKENK